MNIKIRRTASLCLSAAALLALSACAGDAAPGNEVSPPRPVRVAPVTQGPAQPAIVASGVIEPRDELQLSFKLGGVVQDITVREGDAVYAGQLLARLETDEIDAAVSQAREQAQKARRDLERGERLFADDVLARESLDDLRTAAAVAEAALSSAEYNRRHALIRAPADGRVLRRLSEPHELVAAGQALLSLSLVEQGHVLRLGVPDRDLVRLTMEDRATITLDALGGEILHGRVVQIGRGADPRTGTFEVELAIDDAPPVLASGMIGRARIDAGDGAQRDYVPLAALVEGDQSRMSLFVMDGGQVRHVERAIAFVDERKAALVEPLPAGSRVVTDGAAYLRDGETVRVVE